MPFVFLFKYYAKEPYYSSKSQMPPRPRTSSESETSLDGLEDQLMDNLVVRGYLNGKKLGEIAGEQDGFSIGLQEGYMLGSELGLYKGTVLAWLQLMKIEEEYQSNNKHIKINQKVNDLLALIENYPKTNVRDASIHENLVNIRVRYNHLKQYFTTSQAKDVR